MVRCLGLRCLGLLLLLLFSGGAAATSTEDILGTLSGIGRAIFTSAADGAVQASIALKDLPPLTSDGPSHFQGTIPIASRQIAGSRHIINVAPKIAELIKNGVYQNFVWNAIPVNNQLSQIVHKSYEFIGLSWACLNEGLPMAYLPEIFGSDSSFPTMDEIAQGEDVYYLHYAGHLNAEKILEEGILATDVNSRKVEYIVEPCLRAACLMQEKMAQFFQLGEDGNAIAKMVKVIYDAKPWVFHNKNGGNELGENLSDYPIVLYWLQRVHWLIFKLLCPAAAVGNRPMRYRRIFPIGLATKAFMGAKICLGNFVALGIGADLLYLGSHHSIAHPACMMWGMSVFAAKKMLTGYAASFPNHDDLKSRIANMTDDQVKDCLGRMCKLINGWMTQVILPNGESFLMLSIKDVGKAIGVSPTTVNGFLRGRNSKGTPLSKAQIAAGLKGTNLEGVRVCPYDDPKPPLITDDGVAAEQGVEHIDDVLDVHEAIKFSKKRGCGRKADTKVGPGSYQSDPNWIALNRRAGRGLPPSHTYLIDDVSEKVVATFESMKAAGRALHREGLGTFARSIISRSNGDVGRSEHCVYEDLIVETEKGLDKRFGKEKAAKFRNQADRDKENLTNGGTRLEEYRKGSKQSNKRKANRRGSIDSFFAKKPAK